MSEFQPGNYWENRFSSHYDERGVGDIGLSRSYNRYLYLIRRHVFRRLVAMLGIRPDRIAVLDVGSGTGVYVEEWKRLGIRTLTGCDITARAVEELAKRFPGDAFVQADIGEERPLPLTNGTFNVISAFDVLFHIVDDARYDHAIANVASLLSERGYFLYSDNLVANTEASTHYVSRAEPLILATLERHKLEVIRRVPMFVLMNDPVRSNNRLLRRWFGVLYRIAGHSEWSGRMIGIVLVPIELFLTRVVSSGPSTEILVCRKRV